MGHYYDLNRLNQMFYQKYGPGHDTRPSSGYLGSTSGHTNRLSSTYSGSTLSQRLGYSGSPPRYAGSPHRSGYPAAPQGYHKETPWVSPGRYPVSREPVSRYPVNRLGAADRSGPYQHTTHVYHHNYEPDQQASADSSYGSYSPPSHGHSSGGYGGHDSSPALSALALLGFLFFLNLIQQTLAGNAMNGNGGMRGGRRWSSRAVAEDRDEAERRLLDPPALEVDLLTPPQWKQMSTDTVTWLLDIQRSQNRGKTGADEEVSCLQYKLCQMEQHLESRYGLSGRLVALLTRMFLMSAWKKKPEVVSDPLSQNTEEPADRTCGAIYKQCTKAR